MLYRFTAGSPALPAVMRLGSIKAGSMMKVGGIHEYGPMVNKTWVLRNSTTHHHRMELVSANSLRPPTVSSHAMYGMDEAQTCCFLDLRDGTIRSYEGEYASLFRGVIHDAGADNIALELVGNDGIDYLLILDRELNEVSEPIPLGEHSQHSQFVIDDDHVVAESGIWDLEGKQVNDGSFADFGQLLQENPDAVNDGAIQTDDGVYYDCAGQQLFDQVDCTGASQLA